MSAASIAKGAATPPFCWVRLIVALAVAAPCFTGAVSAAPTATAAADLPVGRTKTQACATCHGTDGMSPAPNTPHLAGQPEGYLVDQLKAFRSGRRPSEVRNVVAKPLSDADIAELAAWYAAQEIVLRSGAR